MRGAAIKVGEEYAYNALVWNRHNPTRVTVIETRCFGPSHGYLDEAITGRRKSGQRDHVEVRFPGGGVRLVRTRLILCGWAEWEVQRDEMQAEQRVTRAEMEAKKAEHERRLMALSELIPLGELHSSVGGAPPWAASAVGRIPRHTVLVQIAGKRLWVQISSDRALDFLEDAVPALTALARGTVGDDTPGQAQRALAVLGAA